MEREDRKMLDPQAVQRALRMHSEVVGEFMAPQNLRQNVVGLGIGEKLKGGAATGQLALMALVTHKMPLDALSDADRVPERVGDMPTDVIEVGYPVALAVGTIVMPVARPMRPSVGPANGHPAVVETGYVQLPVTEVEPIVTPELLARRVRPAKGGYSVGHFRITAGTIATCVYDILP